ncbi:MAG: SMP-30/gluconolactonase/LRE family protein [Flavobacteriaceae bacterium]
MPQIKSSIAEPVWNAKAQLGEGPVWDPQRQMLFWVDIEGCKLHSHQPETISNQEWSFNEMVGAAVPTTDGFMLLAMESGLARFSPESGELLYLNVLENSNPKIRFNDGKCDPVGNFWIGTMHKEFLPESGNLYKVDPDYNTSPEIEKTTISNGMAWSTDHRFFYYIDTPSYKVVSFDYNQSYASISNKKVLFRIPKSFGAPDGMTIDNDGMLWIAHWGGSCVRRWNPQNGKVLQEVIVDAPHVTSCCFGGKDFNKLYITTARSGLDSERLGASPLSGALFCVTTQTTGPPAFAFKVKK